jgi:GTP-binding protein
MAKSSLPIVAVVGRPNVGKSTLVNRILQQRVAVVEARPGVTRDRREFRAEWSGVPFMIVDTGGWALAGDEMAADIRVQAEAAVSAADVVLVVSDATVDETEDDRAVARIVQESGVPHLLVANKVDGPRAEPVAARLWSLGLGEPHPVSALHGRNVGDLLDDLIDLLPDVEDPDTGHDQFPTLAIVGRPNVGKSTLLNLLAREERVIVSPEPGTTRDPIDMVVEIDGRPYRLVDTAGMRRPARVDDGTEHYSVLRARGALGEADIALLMVDGTEGVTHQEQRLAEGIVEAGAGLIVLLNKWDIADDEQKAWTEDGVGDRLAFVGWAPVLRISAQSGARTQRLGPAIEAVLGTRKVRVPTPILNREIRTWQEAHPAPVHKGRRARVLYAVQAGTEPPTFILFVRGGDLATDYLRFLENRLREAHDFLGTPIRLFTRRRRQKETDVR